MPRASIPPRFDAPRQLQVAAVIRREILGATEGTLTIADLDGIGGITVIDNGDGSASIAGPSRVEMDLR